MANQDLIDNLNVLKGKNTDAINTLNELIRNTKNSAEYYRVIMVNLLDTVPGYEDQVEVIETSNTLIDQTITVLQGE